LQLAFLSQKDVSEKMSKDIDEMEKMLNDYLQLQKLKLRRILPKLISITFNSIKKNLKVKKLFLKVIIRNRVKWKTYCLK
jgi:two-component system osmolarity sensor histidine kinase EnvZ